MKSVRLKSKINTVTSSIINVSFYLGFPIIVSQAVYFHTQDMPFLWNFIKIPNDLPYYYENN